MKKSTEIMELFESLLDKKNITVSCSDADEEKARKEDESPARIYGMEYWKLVDAIEDILGENESDEKSQKMFTVKIVETYDKAVTVSSKEIAAAAKERGWTLLSPEPTEQDAVNYVNELWKDGKIVLDADNFRDVEFF